jgi:hypothetical protein
VGYASVLGCHTQSSSIHLGDTQEKLEPYLIQPGTHGRTI